MAPKRCGWKKRREQGGKHFDTLPSLSLLPQARTQPPRHTSGIRGMGVPTAGTMRGSERLRHLNERRGVSGTRGERCVPPSLSLRLPTNRQVTSLEPSSGQVVLGKQGICVYHTQCQCCACGHHNSQPHVRGSIPIPIHTQQQEVHLHLSLGSVSSG
mgnify:CR=1 FL=1